MSELDTQLTHGIDDCHETLYCVTVYDSPVGHTLLWAVAILMEDPKHIQYSTYW